MAERNFDFLETLGRKKRVIAGSFAPNAGSALDQTAVKGSGFTVAYVSQGLYRLTLTNSYAALVSAVATIQMASAGTVRFAQVGPYVAGSRTLDLRAVDASAAVQDVAADANNRYNFILVFDDSLTI